MNSNITKLQGTNSKAQIPINGISTSTHSNYRGLTTNNIANVRKKYVKKS